MLTIISNAPTLHIIFALFLITHGLMTLSLSTVPVPPSGALRTPYFPAWWRADVDVLWPAIRFGIPMETARLVGWLLWLSASILFVCAGAGLLGLPLLHMVWQALVVTAAVISLVLLMLFWHPWLVLGVLINVGLIASVVIGVFTRWFVTP